MLWIEIRFEINGTDVFAVGSLRLSIDGTFIQLWILAGSGVDGINIDDRHLFIQHLYLRFNQFAAASFQGSTYNKDLYYSFRYNIIGTNLFPFLIRFSVVFYIDSLSAIWVRVFHSIQQNAKYAGWNEYHIDNTTYSIEQIKTPYYNQKK